MTNRHWAWIVLVIFLAGLGLGFYSIVSKNTALSSTAVIFLVAGAVGFYAVRNRTRDQNPEEPPHTAPDSPDDDTSTK